jgi:hypothetical protein
MTLADAAATVIPGYTTTVKTAISVPDETFEQATKQGVGKVAAGGVLRGGAGDTPV